MINLTNLTTTCGDKFWTVEFNGKPVARLQKPNRAFGGWWVTSLTNWEECREHFTSKDAALAFAAKM